MTWPVVLFLGLQGVVFLYWAALAFRTLFALRRRAVARTGRQFFGPVGFVNVTSEWLRDPATAEDRRWLAGASALLAALTTISALL
ncbi:beta-ketothiolase [Oceanicola granulosus HTCC2516]|uniref:Beta-ketothiolase n=1 Tax=Oceanicola granulosus (strain ATCC BAA-861 / DSM 15982 / KCTC 12143 / HTCC2516) TaxID=314256 RepID=Q2CK62_OCEGH|nr:hypothetical protein [Oceanicola granulosus]EAR52927.1 beta-ketothiolase [Oceanicola granulosus HTCC2516]